jgi:hypothetical protein
MEIDVDASTAPREHNNVDKNTNNEVTSYLVIQELVETKAVIPKTVNGEGPLLLGSSRSEICISPQQEADSPASLTPTEYTALRSKVFSRQPSPETPSPSPVPMSR